MASTSSLKSELSDKTVNQPEVIKFGYTDLVMEHVVFLGLGLGLGLEGPVLVLVLVSRGLVLVLVSVSRGLVLVLVLVSEFWS